MSCSNCGGYNPDSCIMCKRRCRIRIAVLTSPLLLLLTACNPDGSGVTWQDVALWGVLGLAAVGITWARR